MKLLKYLFVVIIIGLSAASCKKEQINTNYVEVTGTIQKQGITTYQYGSHVISGHALRSGTVNLDNYINQSVTIVGHKIEGYPVENGPDYIEVEAIK